jgi:4-cresol dehydrogenase (hydroxylating)
MGISSEKSMIATQIKYNEENSSGFKNSLFQKAIHELHTFLKFDQICVDMDTRLHYSRSTLSQDILPSLILYPLHTDEVQKIMVCANQFKLQVQPISTGKNWGYSDACGLYEGMVILDLSKMNKIIDVNTELGYAVIEPGVTQGQLYQYLNNHNIPFWMDATGAGPDTSIIGNTMERGFGHSALGDRYANSCGYTIVLPDGELTHSGFAGFENSQVSHVYKWGLGPAIDGLFTQSNLGIVTQMTMWLIPKPSHFKIALFMLEEESDIEKFIDCLRPLRMDETLKSVIHIGNDLRIISMSQSYPFEEVDEIKALNREQRKKLTVKHGVDFWSGTAGFYGDKAQVNADIKKFKKALRGLTGVKVVVLDEKRISFAEYCIKILSRFGKGKSLMQLAKKVRMAFELLKGNSPNTCVQGGLWRSKIKIAADMHSNDPRDYSAGFYWISPVLPMTGDAVKQLNKLVEPIFNEYGFDMQQTLSMTTQRALSSVLTISFDKKNEVEALKAKVCHDQVIDTLMKSGYILYRAGNHSMPLIHTTRKDKGAFLTKLKKALDPNMVLAPGRYLPLSID